MFIAAKYEEMYPPEINDFVYITDNAYTKTQIRNMEMLMLESLKFGLGKPLCIHFLRRNSKAGGVGVLKWKLKLILVVDVKMKSNKTGASGNKCEPHRTLMLLGYIKLLIAGLLLKTPPDISSCFEGQNTLV